MHAVRQTAARERARGDQMPSDPLRSDGGDDLTPADVWKLIDEIGYIRHFTRFLAIVELEREGARPINSSNVRTKVKEMTGSDTKPTPKSVLTSMRRFEALGALEREELDDESGCHWTSTDLGRRLARDTALEWCRRVGFDEAADVLADESIDSNE